MQKTVNIGSLFAGIGGFELGAKWALDKEKIPHRTLWQVEQNKFCQSILKKHWPDAQIFDDVKTVGAHNLPRVDILMGGFPCQDISVAGHKKGVKNGKKSILWFDMARVISDLRPPYVVIENVSNIIRLGGVRVVSDLAKIGYSTEWTIISAKEFNLPHLRKRWFCIAADANRVRPSKAIFGRPTQVNGDWGNIQQKPLQKSTDANRTPTKRNSMQKRVSQKKQNPSSAFHGLRTKPAREKPPEPTIRRVDDGFSPRVHNARLRALGNAIVPQCSEWVIHKLITSNHFKEWRQQWKK
jgi:DNA (cytosine-5)-methyltransferase 1